MNKTTVITGPGGEQTTIRERIGCFGRLGCLGWLALLFAIGLPSLWPTPLNILGWVVVGILLLAGLAGKIKPPQASPADYLTQTPGSPQDPPSLPQHSPDGQWWWDGRRWAFHWDGSQWQPVQEVASTPPTAPDPS